MTYMRVRDDTIDKTERANPRLLFVADLYAREATHILYRMFPHNSKFWQYYATYFDEYARAVLNEQYGHSSLNAAYDVAEFHRIAKGKAAMAKYPVAALAILDGQEDKIRFLAESLDCYHVGYQYWDDLVDWKEDLANSMISLLLARALEHITVTEARLIAPEELREKIGRVIYYSNLATEQLDRSYDWLERAYDLALSAECKTWAAQVKRLQEQTVVLKEDLSALASAQMARCCPRTALS
jgi:hypothetical protein